MNSTEAPNAFVSRWSSQLSTLQDQLTNNVSNLNEMSGSIQSLSIELTEWASSLPSYELRRCERELKVVMDTLKQLSAPKKKFGFTKTIASTSKTIPSIIPKPSTSASSPAVSTSNSTAITPIVPTTSLTLSNKKDSYLSTSDLPLSQSTISEALLLNSLERCLVDLTPSESDSSTTGYSAIYLYSLKDSVILIPPVKGSIMVHNCSNCILILGSHQYRMHSSSNCKIYLQTGSTPIIEHCTSLIFGESPPFIGKSTSSSTTNNNFASVQDFDYPFAGPLSPSPNWKLKGVDDVMWKESWFTKQSREMNWKELIP